MLFIITLIFANLYLASFLCFTLLHFLAPGNLIMYRIIVAAVLIAGNFLLWSFRNKFSTTKSLQTGHLGFIFPVIVAGSAIFFIASVLQPHGMWDAWTMWNKKGMDYTHSFLQGLPFVASRSDWIHPDYPPFYSMQLSFTALLFGRWSVWIPILLSFIYYLLIILMLVDYANQLIILKEHYFKVIFLLAVLSPIMLTQVINQCADLPLSVFFMLCFYIIFKMKSAETGLVPNSGKNLIFLALGLVVGILPYIKSEGMILFPVLFMLLLWLLKKQWTWATVFCFLIGISFPLCILIYFNSIAIEEKVYQSEISFILEKMQDITRYLKITISFIVGHILFMGSFIIYFLVKGLRNHFKKTLVYSLPIILPFIAYHAAFLLSPLPLEMHLKTAYLRITLQFYPALFLIALEVFSNKSTKILI